MVRSSSLRRSDQRTTLPAGGYSAARAAAFSVTQALRGELAKKHISVHAVFPGPVDTDMVRAFDMVKTSPEAVARAIIEGVEEGLEEILPDPASRQMFAVWKGTRRGRTEVPEPATGT